MTRMIAAAALLLGAAVWGQVSVRNPEAVVGADLQDAQATKERISELLERYPPALRNALGADASLLGNEIYLAPYPALVSFLKTHPEVARDPGFYLERFQHRQRLPIDRSTQIIEIWRDVLAGAAAFAGFTMALGLLVWLTKTLIDARRWNRVARVQTDVHMKLLDRFANNEELLTYIQSPAGARFLESAPITLDAPQRSVGAPLSRILWSLQGGIVILAAGLGLWLLGKRVSVPDAAEPMQVLGILAIALGVGFVASAAISFVISRRLGLIETVVQTGPAQRFS